MPGLRNTTLGHIEVRDVADGQPGRFEGLAIPYGVTIAVSYGQERFIRGAFARMVEEVNAGERLAYLNRHGEDGGVPVGVINHLQERDAGLFFGGDFMDVPETPQARSAISSGLNGVSVEFVPGKHRRKGDVVEHFADARLAAVAGSYAPAYREARVAIRSAAGAAERKGKVPSLSTSALTERRDTLVAQARTVRQLAEAEDRSLSDDETTEIETLDRRVQSIGVLITEAEAEDRRKETERQSLPQAPAGKTSAIITRSEPVYGPGRGQSFFADLIGVASRDAAALDRMSRHKALVMDLAVQIERRAVDSVDLAGAYPTQYFPDLYVPDIAYNGPLSAFFADTPITSPNPMIIPAFDEAGLVGDTGEQTAENLPLPNIDMATKPLTVAPKTIGGETTVSRQSVDGANPGTDVIIGNVLRELLMRDRERMIALVLEALTASGDVGGTGEEIHAGLAGALGKFYAGDAAGGANARFLPAEGVFVNATTWGELIGAVDAAGRPLMPFITPTNALGTVQGQGFQSGVIGGVPVTPAWALLSANNEVVARRTDARQWSSAVLDIRLMEREGPQSIVFAIWQYYAFAVLQPRGVRIYTTTPGLP